MKKHLISVFLIIVLFSSCLQKSTEKPCPECLYIDSSVTENGVYLYYTMRNGQKHGKSWYFDRDIDYPGFYNEALYINDVLLITKEFREDSLYYGYRIFYHTQDSAFHLASLVQSQANNQRVNLKSNYFEVEAPDTICFGQPYIFKINAVLGLFKEFRIDLKLGELTEDLYLIPPFKEFSAEGRELTVEIKDYKKGINLLTGKMSYSVKNLSKDHDALGLPSNPFIFYHQFVVIDPK
jgi:hypothetical protein